MKSIYNQLTSSFHPIDFEFTFSLQWYQDAEDPNIPTTNNSSLDIPNNNLDSNVDANISNNSANPDIPNNGVDPDIPNNKISEARIYNEVRYSNIPNNNDHWHPDIPISRDFELTDSTGDLNIPNDNVSINNNVDQYIIESKRIGENGNV
eukprot:jgi/Psemu1/31566/gm1.31566_g